MKRNIEKKKVTIIYAYAYLGKLVDLLLSKEA